MYVRSALTAMICLTLFGFTSAHARVTGQCGNCHTMHNSQNGLNQMLNPSIDGTEPKPALTRGSCVGCHTGEPGSGSGATPYVNTATAPTTALAGGNFYWATQDGAKGHNVKGVPNMLADPVLTDAPGNTASTDSCATDNCHNSLFKTTDVATGCEGCHLEPAHHAPQQTTGAAATANNGYFRFLSGCPDGSALGKGVEGIEDNDWQYTKGNTDHNEYLGNADGSKTGTGGMAANGNTMTGYCTGCHGNFHVQSDGNSNWIRHPSDAVLPITGEYQYFTVYDPDVPIARANLDAGVTGAVAPGTDMVMCLSCHKAHGSEHDDMLRWEYSGMVAGGGGDDGNGCFKCHTEKDS